MISEQEIKKKIEAIEGMIRIANTQLELAIAKKNTEEQYNAQYLVNEYEGMLEETKEFYNVKYKVCGVSLIAEQFPSKEQVGVQIPDSAPKQLLG